MTENELANLVFEVGLKVHKALGPGLLEISYYEYFFCKIKKMGTNVEK